MKPSLIFSFACLVGGLQLVTAQSATAVCNKDCSNDMTGPFCIKKKKKLQILQFGECQVEVLKCLKEVAGAKLPRLSYVECPECAKRCMQPANDNKKPTPVCDSKGKRYFSQCMFDNAKCADETLELGVCPETCREDCSGDKTGPVCVIEDNKINVLPVGECWIRRKNCIADARGKPQITTTACPTCVKKCKRRRAKGEKPPCDSNGRKYKTQCELDNAICVDNTITQVECPECNKNCPEVIAKVCGSDGRTYGNICKMELKSCRSGEQITMAYDGKCKSRKEQRKEERQNARKNKNDKD